MSTQDIIYILPETFRELGNNTTCCAKIKDTYSQLLNKYDCFTKPDVVINKFMHNNHHTHNGNRGFTNRTNNQNLNYTHTFQKHEKYSCGKVSSFHSSKVTARVLTSYQYKSTSVTIFTKRTKIGNDSDDPEDILNRQLKGHMNVINNNNFLKISAKIQRLATVDYIESIIHTILDTACLQVFYISIFYRLLNDVINCYDGDDVTKKRIQLVLHRYIGDFIENKEFIYKTSSESTTPWFYQQQKHKMLASSKGIVVLELLKHGHSSYWTISSYSQCLIEELIDLHDDLHDEIPKEVKELNIDVILNLLRDIKTKFSQVFIDSDLMNEMKKTKSCQRIRFMIEDIIALQT